jgi:hypothetical protein
LFGTGGVWQKKIDVDGLVGAGADFRELVAQAVRREHRAW